MNVVTDSSFYADIYISGPIEKAEEICREYCLTGLCVTISPTKFIYTGGEETGVVVGLKNYPRFPNTPVEITVKARQLAETLMLGMHQLSVMVNTPAECNWIHRRDEYAK